MGGLTGVIRALRLGGGPIGGGPFGGGPILPLRDFVGCGPIANALTIAFTVSLLTGSRSFSPAIIIICTGVRGFATRRG